MNFADGSNKILNCFPEISRHHDTINKAIRKEKDQKKQLKMLEAFLVIHSLFLKFVQKMNNFTEEELGIFK